MVKVKKNSLFVRFLLIALVALSAPLQAVFSFKDLYNSVASKVAFKKGKEKVAEIVVASKKPVNEEFKKIQKKIGILLMVFGLAGLAGCYLIDKIAHPFDPLNPPHNPQHNPFRPIHPDLAPEPRPHPGHRPFIRVEPRHNPISDLPRVEPRPLLNPIFIINEPVEGLGKVVVEEHKAIEGQTKECPICYEDKNPEDMYEFSCCKDQRLEKEKKDGKEIDPVLFCKKCLLGESGPFVGTVKNKKIDLLVCPNRNCKLKNSENCVEKTIIRRSDRIALLGEDSELFKAIEKIEDKKSLSLLGQDGGYRECKTRDCPVSYIIPSDNQDMFLEGDIVCPKCHDRYCADCQISHSRNVTCNEAKAEAERVAKMNETDIDRANKACIENTTKPCPNCKTKIEKNKGCKHMTCHQCRWEYCWDCLQGGMGHGGYPHRSFHDCPAHP